MPSAMALIQRRFHAAVKTKQNLILSPKSEVKGLGFEFELITDNYPAFFLIFAPMRNNFRTVPVGSRFM